MLNLNSTTVHNHFQHPCRSEKLQAMLLGWQLLLFMTLVISITQSWVRLHKKSQKLLALDSCRRPSHLKNSGTAQSIQKSDDSITKWLLCSQQCRQQKLVRYDFCAGSTRALSCSWQLRPSFRSIPQQSNPKSSTAPAVSGSVSWQWPNMIWRGSSLEMQRSSNLRSFMCRSKYRSIGCGGGLAPFQIVGSVACAWRPSLVSLGSDLQGKVTLEPQEFLS